MGNLRYKSTFYDRRVPATLSTIKPRVCVGTRHGKYCFESEHFIIALSLQHSLKRGRASRSRSQARAWERVGVGGGRASLC